jgi:GT2 family glycosyltransferase
VKNMGSAQTPRIAVVICTYNRPAVLERCLQHLQQVGDLAFEVIVIDSAPRWPDARSVAARYGADYRVSSLRGLSRARNIGARATRADIIAYLDDDMVTHPRWLKSISDAFSDNSVAAVTGPILPLELINSSRGGLQSAVEMGPWGPHRFEVGRSSCQWFERTNFGGIGDGNFAIRRSALNKIRGFDERLGRGAAIDASEEHYAYFNLVEQGGKIAYIPDAIVFHPTPRTTRDVVRKQVSDTTAFAAFLAWNCPLKAWRVAKFLIEGAFRVRRSWRRPPRSSPASLSTTEKVASAIAGLSIFLRSVRQTSQSSNRSLDSSIPIHHWAVPVVRSVEAITKQRSHVLR